MFYFFYLNEHLPVNVSVLKDKYLRAFNVTIIIIIIFD